MTTPATMNGILTRLRERLEDARREQVESQKSINSYAAGYNDGYAVSLAETIQEITGENP